MGEIAAEEAGAGAASLGQGRGHVEAGRPCIYSRQPGRRKHTTSTGPASHNEEARTISPSLDFSFASASAGGLDIAR